MTKAIQIPLLPVKHLNQGLFSDYYLDHIVPSLAEWQSPQLHAQAKVLRDELKTLLESVHPDTLDEAQLEEQWVKPVLQKLGHHWSVQVKIRYRDRGYRKPDYVFTATSEEAHAFTNQIYEPLEIAHALGLGDAKKWGVNLDQTSEREGRNPSQQIDEYLRYSELPWGILTDGRFWRLYERNSSKDNDYYAVDLPALLMAETVDDFFYFYLFFRPEAFVKDSWLEQVLKGSENYAESLSDQLEDEVYTALELIAQGFLNYRRNRLNPDPPTLKIIYEQSLVLLYRLLFIFYAESRDVLPIIENKLYADNQSLRAIARRVADKMEKPTTLKLAVDKSETYTQLSDLFFMIDSGSPEYDVTAYNGRLFSPEEHPFLTSKMVGDAYLVPALDRLARIDARVRTERDGRRVFVDYRDLDVRHLGAIYEKLLEYQLDIATEPLALKDGKYAPTTDNEKAIKLPNEVYLRTGNYERKITGSYYTPDYIVRFIVEHTLEPLLTEITQQYAQLDAEGHWQVRDPEALQRAILAINVLDPATGSGHFMVETVAYIAEWLRRLGMRPQDMDENEDELVYWKRQVVTTCVYGVDVNPLAVELARLSLWLTTIQRGKPLSFLDHHVKLGNTLVGARLSDIQRGMTEEKTTNGQMELFTDEVFINVVTKAVSRMTSIETTTVSSINNVKEQEYTYTELKDTLAPLRRFADYWTSRYFESGWNPDAMRVFYDVAMKGSMVTAEALTELAEEHHFFHWELEFPEVFFTPDGQPLAEGGFDAVVGNPPYVRQERIIPIKPYLEANYEVYAGTADLFLYFYERALKLVKASRRIGYITSGTFMNSNSAVAFRKYLHEQAAFETVVNFGENQPFKGAEMVYPTMAILKNSKPESTFRSLFVEDVYPRAILGDAIHDLPMVETASDVTALDEWRFQSVELTRLLRKVTEGYQTLGKIIDERMYRGVTTGLNEAFVIDEATRKRLIDEHSSSAEIIKPMLRGQDLRPWYQIKSNQYLIFTRQGIDIDVYPAVKNYLEQFHNLLEPKPNHWTGKEWEGRKAGSYKWYEIQDNIAYYQEFEKRKIIWSDISKLPRFSMNENSYVANTGFVIGSEKYSLLGILQSRVIWFAISQIAQPLRLRAGLWQYRLIVQFIERLPIPELSDTQESELAKESEAITVLANARYQLDEAMRKRLAADLVAGGKLNEKLENWWELDFAELREEIKKAFKRDIPVGDRDDWERYLADQQKKHQQATQAIITREKVLNDIVYAAFNLTQPEIVLIEQATKYPYGAI